MIGALRAGDYQHKAEKFVSVCPTRMDWQYAKNRQTLCGLAANKVLQVSASEG
jgi:hypothetical protein